jgi:CheY-like chemotaxis protein
VARVVVIDDEALVADACAAVLRAAGYQVSVAHDGESGAQLIRQILPDVVVSDIRMPGIDGHELVSLLKNEPTTTHIPVLLISGHGNSDQSRCDAFLAKPFVVSELLAVVRQLTRQGPGSPRRVE